MLPATLRNLKNATTVGAFSMLAISSASAGWFGCGFGANQRPYYDPSCEPNWGVQETNWRRFPSTGQYGQGSYCPDGGCQPQIDASYMNGAAEISMQPGQGNPGGSIMLHTPSPAQNAQPLLLQPPIQNLPPPAGNPSAGGMMAPIYEAPAPSIPYSIPQPSGDQMPMLNMPQQQQQPLNVQPQLQPNPAPLVAPQPTHTDLTPLLQPGSGQRVMPPNPQSKDGGLGAPVPMPMENLPMPPMPGASRTQHYRSPFNNVGYQVYDNQPTMPNANYGNSPEAYSSPTQQTGSYTPISQPPKSKNPFSMISRLWSRQK